MVVSCIFYYHRYGFSEIFIFNPYLRGKDFGETVSADLNTLFAGFVLIILYVTIMLGEFNRKLHKIWLALTSVAAVGFAIGRLALYTSTD